MIHDLICPLSSVIHPAAMPTDHIRYDILAQAALRGVVRTVLVDVAEKGLPGEHHFKITFNTAASGVRLSERLRAQYPREMTIVLQHQFWDLAVTEQGFEVGLSFGGIPERVAIPFESITAFYDPAVQFGFQFETVEAAGAAAADDANASAQTAKPSTDQVARPPVAETKPESLPAPSPAAAPAPAAPKSDRGPGGEVVRLDRFRKKT